MVSSLLYLRSEEEPTRLLDDTVSGLAPGWEDVGVWLLWKFAP